MSKDRGLFRRKKIWYIQYFHEGRRYREAIGESKTEAKNALAARKTQIKEGRFYPGKKREFNTSWDEFLPVFKKWAEKNLKPKSFKRYLTNIVNLAPYFSGKRLSHISPRMIEYFKNSRIDNNEVSPTTVNRDLACLKRMYNLAIKWGFLENNPVCKVDFFKENSCRMRYLGEEEIDLLLSVCPLYLRDIVEFDINTGLRKGELFSLKWNDIDLHNKLLTVKNTKNYEDRVVPLNDIALNVLCRIPRQLRSEYVFTTPSTEQGSQITDIKKSFKTALQKAGIKDFRFHDLRHTFASHLVMAGVDLTTVKELLGHKDIKMTLRYAHLSPNHRKRGVDMLCKRYQTATKVPQVV
jgi:integrase